MVQMIFFAIVNAQSPPLQVYIQNMSVRYFVLGLLVSKVTLSKDFFFKPCSSNIWPSLKTLNSKFCMFCAVTGIELPNDNLHIDRPAPVVWLNEMTYLKFTQCYWTHTCLCWFQKGGEGKRQYQVYVPVNKININQNYSFV